MCLAEDSSSQKAPGTPAPRSLNTKLQASCPGLFAFLLFLSSNSEGGERQGLGSQNAYKSSLPWGPSWAPSHPCRPNKGDPLKTSPGDLCPLLRQEKVHVALEDDNIMRSLQLFQNVM
ncbi:hypothetical protein HispidOSU_027356 [Sigmodon hispidus]